MPIDMSEDQLARLIRDVIEEHMGTKPSASGGTHKTDRSGVMSIDLPRVAAGPFPFPIDVPDGSVLLTDLLTLEESPRVGCGVMEMDHCAFPWTLKYDEVDYVIEGTLELVMNGNTMRANAGQVLYIPKNTPLTFTAPGKVRFFYVVYPANWSEQ